MEVDIQIIERLADSASKRAKELHAEYEEVRGRGWPGLERASSLLNDFFYWSGKATSYRGIVAMAEMQTVVEDELDAEGSCP